MNENNPVTSVVTIEDLTNSQIEDVLDLAAEIDRDREALYGVASRHILASLFFEPSTRTRGSFESAMNRLGGRVITTADAKSSSMAKGETLADTVRIWSGYADLMVIRHPWEGAARLAAEYSDVPVINAGDGGHEHPTQTLLDLYTLRNEYRTLEGLRIALCGDLKNSRTVHSLVYALIRFGAEIVFVPAQGLELPDHVRNKMETVYDRRIERVDPGGLQALYGDDSALAENSARVDALYVTPSQPHLRAMYEEGAKIDIQLQDGRPLAIYVTRQQVEREADGHGEGSAPRAYPRITASTMSGSDFSKAIIMHPLPRVDELSSDMDSDHRSKYFVQARNGVPIRMALISLVLGLKPWRSGSKPQPWSGDAGQITSQPDYIQCGNPDCVTQRESQNAKGEFIFFRRPGARFVCGYCEREVQPSYFARPRGEVYYPIDQFRYPSWDASDSLFFTDANDAETLGLRPALIAARAEPLAVEVIR
ncbi:MAG: aspartate carbamoyltransferase [SAR202 cluster bacterium Io17-Chloro-G9]|nr:MAG: aspartate carbamoyltransferase [SAR202 cluster bacterium Io17-Chloro-G9]